MTDRVGKAHSTELMRRVFQPLTRMAHGKTIQKEKGAYKFFPTNGSLLTTQFLKGDKLMAVLIKGMELPKSCDDCDFMYTVGQYASRICLFAAEIKESCVRASDCPLVEVPENALIVDRHKLFSGEHNLYSWDEIEEAEIAIEPS